jgi:hypothetical protein
VGGAFYSFLYTGKKSGYQSKTNLVKLADSVYRPKYFNSMYTTLRAYIPVDGG